MSLKSNLVLIFGGKNTEHEVSILTAKSVFQNLDQNKYTTHLIYITKSGEWQQLQDLESLPQINSQLKKTTDWNQICALLSQSNTVVFPLIHGKYGEDGTLQGMLEMLDVKYVGCGVLASSLAMDKSMAKIVFQSAGLKTARSITLYSQDDPTDSISQIQAEFLWPVFVKPSRQGSSVGVSKVKHVDDLKKALIHAFEYDSKVLVEEFIQGREIECAVLGSKSSSKSNLEDPKASILGEITSKNEFYDYHSKYTEGEADLQIPASLTDDLVSEIQSQAITAFKSLDCRGLARVDFFLTAQNDIYINEINTLPGFTSLSMYPMLWSATGLQYGDLLDELVDRARG